MIEIIPAIMPSSFKDLKKQISLVDDLVQWVQVDVMDGKFVPSESWPYNGKDTEQFGQILGQASGLPGWNKVNFEIDMMVDEPEAKMIDWINAGAGRLIFHLESLHDQISPNLFTNLKEQYGDALEIGLALNTSTDNSNLNPFMEYLDVVQFMGIEKVGYQGQDFDERVLEKIKELRSDKPDMTIAVDGSVNTETIKSLVDAGANRLAIGSALISSSSDSHTVHQKYEDFVKMVN